MVCADHPPPAARAPPAPSPLPPPVRRRRADRRPGCPAAPGRIPLPASAVPVSGSQLKDARGVFQRMPRSASMMALHSDLAWSRGQLNPLSTKNTLRSWYFSHSSLTSATTSSMGSNHAVVGFGHSGGGRGRRVRRNCPAWSARRCRIRRCGTCPFPGRPGAWSRGEGRDAQPLVQAPPRRPASGPRPAGRRPVTLRSRCGRRSRRMSRPHLPPRRDRVSETRNTASGAGLKAGPPTMMVASAVLDGFGQSRPW